MPRTVKEYCEYYFRNYNADFLHRKAWLAIREKRYKEIRENDFYLGSATTFKNEVLKFREGDEVSEGYSYQNSRIRKNNGSILFQNEKGETPMASNILTNLDNLELHGNYSWSKMHMGGDITANMQSLGRTVDFLKNEVKSIEERINGTLEWDGEYKIQGLSKGKVTMLLHIFKPEKYGVWNGPVEATFRILGQVDDWFKIREGNIGKKYKKINTLLNDLLKEYPQVGAVEDGKGFKNLSDVDIFMWYIADRFGKKINN